MILSLLLSAMACGAGSEKDKFINASIEIGCAMFKDPEFFKDFSKIEAKTKEIFAKYGFNTDDATAMQALADKYQNDESVKQALQDGITKCAGDVFANGAQLIDKTPTTTPATTP